MKYVRTHFLFAFICIVAFSASAEGEYEGDGIPTVVLEYFEDASGDFRLIIESDLVHYGEDLAVGQNIPIGATLVTGQSDFAELRLDPTGSIIKISENTTFSIDSLQKLIGEDENIFSIPIGKIRAIIGRTTGEEKYQFKGGSAVGSIRGTDFGMEVVPGQTERLFVLSGSVEFANAAGKSVVVGPNMIVDAEDPAFKPIVIPKDTLSDLLKGLEFEKLTPTSVPGYESHQNEQPKAIHNSAAFELQGGLASLSLAASYERLFKLGIAAKLGISIWHQYLDDWDFTQFAMYPAARYYFNDLFNYLFTLESTAPNGLFIEVGADVYYIIGTSTVRKDGGACTSNVTGLFVGPAVELGYKLVVNNTSLQGVFIEPAVGYSYAFGSFDGGRTCPGVDQVYVYNQYRPGGFTYSIRFGLAF